MNSISEAGSEAVNEEITKSKFFTKLYLASLYFITVGVLYLWGYWPSFGVNILEFLDFSDILKVTAYPIAIGAVITVAGGAVGNWMAHKKQHQRGKSSNVALDLNLLSDEELELELAESQVRLKSAERKLTILRVLYFVATLASIVAIFMHSVFGWIFFPLLLSLPLATWISDLPSLEKVIKNDRVRVFAAFVASVIPAYAYGTGRVAASNILDGEAFHYVISDIAGYTGNTSGNNLRFVGHASDYIFLYDAKEEALVFIKLDDDKAVSLKHYERKGKLDEWKLSLEKAMQNVPSLWK